MNLVLWIDHNTFVTGLVEKAFKLKSMGFYSLPNVDDFAYLVEDLNPTLIVLDGATYEKNPAGFRKQYEGSEKMQQIPFILLEAQSNFEFIKNKLGVLSKPLEPFKLPDQLTAMLSGDYN